MDSSEPNSRTKTYPNIPDPNSNHSEYISIPADHHVQLSQYRPSTKPPPQPHFYPVFKQNNYWSPFFEPGNQLRERIASEWKSTPLEQENPARLPPLTTPAASPSLPLAKNSSYLDRFVARQPINSQPSSSSLLSESKATKILNPPSIGSRHFGIPYKLAKNKQTTIRSNPPAKQSTHMLDSLPSQESHEDAMEKPTSQFVCDEHNCNEVFPSMHDLQLHHATEHRFQCMVCGRVKGLSTSFLLERHILEEHDSFFKIQAEQQPMYLCLSRGCGAVFHSSMDRDSHCRVVHAYPLNFSFSAFS